MTENLTRWYSSDSTQQELSIEFQHDRVMMVFKNLCVLVLLCESNLSIRRVNKLVDLYIVQEFISDLRRSCGSARNRKCVLTRRYRIGRSVDLHLASATNYLSADLHPQRNPVLYNPASRRVQGVVRTAINPFTLRGALETIVCYSHTFENNLGIK